MKELKRKLKKERIKRKVTVEIFNRLIETLEKNAEDNQVTISNVSLFARLWREELELELEINNL